MNRREFLGAAACGAVGASLCRCDGAVLLGAETPKGAKPHPRKAAAGPLRVHPDNRRYFTDGTGRAVHLTGSHTWANLVDIGPSDPPPKFDFAAYLDFLDRYGHNFIRLWTWELTQWNTRANSENKLHTSAPQPFARTGPGKALDGKPKFDLTRFDPDYFDRLRKRVAAAGERGIYVSVMLFEGWGLQFSADAWKAHPFHPDNNVNRIDGDKDGDGRGVEIHALAVPAVTALQEAYVRKVVDTLSDLDNVLYEISNENHPPSTKWQYHVIDLIHRDERQKAKQHPVGMTFQYKGGSNRTLFESPADWISPNPEGGYRDDPPAADGSKVILTDTDHLWGIGGNGPWAWKSFLRGMNPIFMDSYDGVVLGARFDPKWEPVRKAMGQSLRVAGRVDLAAMVPKGELASTRYCLAGASEGRAQYLVYLPAGGEAAVDLSAAKGRLRVEWFSPARDAWTPAAAVEGGATRKFAAPFPGEAVLRLETA